MGECKIVRLGDVIVSIHDGGTPPRKSIESTKYFNGMINWCTIKDIKEEIYSTNEKLTELGLKKCSSKLFPIDSIIISLGATIGKVGIAKNTTATKQGISGIIVDKEKVIPKYLYYVLKKNKDKIQSMATGATIKEVRPNKLANLLQIPIPPLHIQQKIVEELDNIQEGIDAGEKLIACLKKQLNLDSFRFAHHFDNGSL